MYIKQFFKYIFFEGSKNVQRWYKIPGIGMKFQPSELSKLGLVMTLAWFLERNKSTVTSWSTLFLAFTIVLVPFILIYKQPFFWGGGRGCKFYTPKVLNITRTYKTLHLERKALWV